MFLLSSAGACSSFSSAKNVLPAELVRQEWAEVVGDGPDRLACLVELLLVERLAHEVGLHEHLLAHPECPVGAIGR